MLFCLILRIRNPVVVFFFLLERSALYRFLGHRSFLLLCSGLWNLWRAFMSSIIHTDSSRAGHQKQTHYFCDCSDVWNNYYNMQGAKVLAGLVGDSVLAGDCSFSWFGWNEWWTLMSAGYSMTTLTFTVWTLFVTERSH